MTMTVMTRNKVSGKLSIELTKQERDRIFREVLSYQVPAEMMSYLKEASCDNIAGVQSSIERAMAEGASEMYDYFDGAGSVYNFLDEVILPSYHSTLECISKLIPDIIRDRSNKI